jgi:hypothetical protein
MLSFSVLPESFLDKFWIFFLKMSRIDLSPSVSGSKKIKFRMISFAIKFSKLYSLKILDVHDDSLQYVESSHAPYQRIRFF